MSGLRQPRLITLRWAENRIITDGPMGALQQADRTRPFTSRRRDHEWPQAHQAGTAAPELAVEAVPMSRAGQGRAQPGVGPRLQTYRIQGVVCAFGERVFAVGIPQCPANGFRVQDQRSGWSR